MTAKMFNQYWQLMKQLRQKHLDNEFQRSDLDSCFDLLKRIQEYYHIEDYLTLFNNQSNAPQRKSSYRVDVLKNELWELIEAN